MVCMALVHMVADILVCMAQVRILVDVAGHGGGHGCAHGGVHIGLCGIQTVHGGGHDCVNCGGFIGWQGSQIGAQWFTTIITIVICRTACPKSAETPKKSNEANIPSCFLIKKTPYVKVLFSTKIYI